MSKLWYQPVFLPVSSLLFLFVCGLRWQWADKEVRRGKVKRWGKKAEEKVRNGEMKGDKDTSLTWNGHSGGACVCGCVCRL